MTLDDLEILFRDKIAAGHEIRTGVRSVVLALRDEFDSIMWGDDEWNNKGIVGHFNDILGSGVAATTQETTHEETFRRAVTGQHSDRPFTGNHLGPTGPDTKVSALSPVADADAVDRLSPVGSEKAAGGSGQDAVPGSITDAAPAADLIKEMQRMGQEWGAAPNTNQNLPHSNPSPQCEWTPIKNGHAIYRIACEADYLWAVKNEFCPSCGRNIKFKEPT